MGEINAVVLLQVDGIGLNAVTFGVVSAVVLALVTAITFLFKMVTSDRDRQIDQLTRERDLLLEKLFDMAVSGERAADVGEEALKELMQQRGRGTRGTTRKP